VQEAAELYPTRTMSLYPGSSRSNAARIELGRDASQRSPN
jgi:hypothetical protein